MSVVRLAVALTIWFDVVIALLLFIPQTLPEQFDLPGTFIVLSFYVLMPVRWGLVLTLLMRRVRARPLRWLPRAFPIQAVVIAVVQLLLGLLSLVGFLMIVVNTQRSEHVIGVVLHVVVPTVVVYALARSSMRTPSTLSP